MSEQLTVADLAIGLEQGQIVMIDVRPAPDVAAGHIPGAWVVEMTALAARLRDPDDPLFLRLRGWSSPVALIAGDHDRFQAAVAMFAEVGTAVSGVPGEVSAWSRQGRPLNRGART
jgi:rhodanese-related sulfurtransferase